MRQLYLECYSGISGDMTVGALIDLGADREVLANALSTLPLSGYEIKISEVMKSGIRACDFDVILDKELENHDHDIEYLYGHEHHSYEAHKEEGHVHRTLGDVEEIIEASSITDKAKDAAKRIFEVLAKAEAKVHGKCIDEVHFHEVGAVDSIVDIVSVAVCLDNLGIEEVIVPYLYEGEGTIRCAHGVLPIPVPATSEIVVENKINLRQAHVQGELVTPTGAAIVAAVRTKDSLPEEYSIERIGHGAGKRNYERPSLVRAMIIENKESVLDERADKICRMETNIDDCTGEALGRLMSLLMEAGARDVHYVPVFMKKNRPAYELVVICDEACREGLEAIIFAETTTIGIRRIYMDRTMLKRREEQISTEWGPARVKVCTLPDGREKRYPEYESVNNICNKSGKSFQEVYNLITNL